MVRRNKATVFPLIKDDEWGARLSQADLAVNKVLAASSRRQARDIADLVAINMHYCPLGPIIMAAAGKPPQWSPQKTIDYIRHHALEIPSDDYLAINGLPEEWTAEFIKEEIMRIADEAERYVLAAPIDVIGVMAVDKNGVPIAVTEETLGYIATHLEKPPTNRTRCQLPTDIDFSSWIKLRP